MCFVIVVCRGLVFVLGKLGSKRNLCLVWVLVKCESVGCLAGYILLQSFLYSSAYQGHMRILSLVTLFSVADLLLQ